MTNLGEVWKPHEVLGSFFQVLRHRRRMMREAEFWSIIDLFDWQHHGDDQAVLASAVKALAAKPLSSITGFEERLAFLLYQLDTRSHAMKMQGDDSYLSPDDFLYARCVVVANGEAFYEAVLQDANMMPKGLVHFG